VIIMSISQTIAPLLPYLRRYARALCGNQHGGDEYVCATLESLIADPSAFASEKEPRVALYRQFAKLWNSFDFNTSNGPGPGPEFRPDATISRNLQAITPRPRQAFLLTSVEGFTTEQAAAILETDAVGITQLIDQAGHEIAEQVATEVLIIEDEPIIAMDLAGIAESLGHRVIGRARTQKEAIRAIAHLKPGLILADIQLADGSSGLDAVNDILGTNEVPVIFITAYPERLLTGERPEPTFLITKPFEADMVKAIVSQALFFGARARRQDKRVATA
jgi:DNA-directed RNA polymerase specialized sigma24 family protein